MSILRRILRCVFFLYMHMCVCVCGSMQHACTDLSASFCVCTAADRLAQRSKSGVEPARLLWFIRAQGNDRKLQGPMMALICYFSNHSYDRVRGHCGRRGSCMLSRPWGFFTFGIRALVPGQPASVVAASIHLQFQDRGRPSRKQQLQQQQQQRHQHRYDRYDDDDDYDDGDPVALVPLLLNRAAKAIAKAIATCVYRQGCMSLIFAIALTIIECP